MRLSSDLKARHIVDVKERRLSEHNPLPLPEKEMCLSNTSQQASVTLTQSAQALSQKQDLDAQAEQQWNVIVDDIEKLICPDDNSSNSLQMFKLNLSSNIDTPDKKHSGINYGYLRKTRICFHHTIGTCSRGDRCAFAHSFFELRKQPNLHKTQLCINFQKKMTCMKGNDCRFAHGHGELRKLDFTENTKPKVSKSRQAYDRKVEQQLHEKQCGQFKKHDNTSVYRYSSFSADELAKTVLKQARKKQLCMSTDYSLGKLEPVSPSGRMSSYANLHPWPDSDSVDPGNQYASLSAKSITAYINQTLLNKHYGSERKKSTQEYQSFDDDDGDDECDENDHDPFFEESSMIHNQATANYTTILNDTEQINFREKDPETPLNWSNFFKSHLDNDFDFITKEGVFEELKQGSSNFENKKNVDTFSPSIFDSSVVQPFSRRSLRDFAIKAKDMMYSDDTPCDTSYTDFQTSSKGKSQDFAPGMHSLLEETSVLDSCQNIQSCDDANRSFDASLGESKLYRILLMKGQDMSGRRDLVSPTTSCSTSKTFTVERQSFSSDTRDGQEL